MKVLLFIMTASFAEGVVDLPPEEIGYFSDDKYYYQQD